MRKRNNKHYQVALVVCLCTHVAVPCNGTISTAHISKPISIYVVGYVSLFAFGTHH